LRLLRPACSVLLNIFLTHPFTTRSNPLGRPIFVREDREQPREFTSSNNNNGNSNGGNNNSSNSISNSNGGGGGGGSGNGCAVYVGNLSWEVKWQDLKDHMKQAGTVLHADVMEEPNGRSKGCGIVEYGNPKQAQHAIDVMSETELLGRQIFVREDRVGSGGGGGEC
jgi:RNA recognition motif-containing protein